MDRAEVEQIVAEMLDERGYRIHGSNVRVVDVEILPDGRMTTRNVARWLGLSEKSLAVFRTEGRGPEYIRITRRIFYTVEMLQTWVTEGERICTA